MKQTQNYDSEAAVVAATSKYSAILYSVLWISIAIAVMSIANCQKSVLISSIEQKAQIQKLEIIHSNKEK